MGLRDKIKGALHNDRDDEYGTTHNTTGTYDSSTTHGTTGTHNTTGDFSSSHNDPKYGSTNTAGLGSSNTYGNTSTNAGPHDSNMANKADPRVDSDRDHRANPASNVGSNTYGTHGTHDSTGAGIGHRTTDSGVGLDGKTDRYDAAGNKQDPYWGSMGHAGRNSPPGTTTSHALAGETERDRLQRKDLPLRPNEQQSGVTSNIGGTTSNIGGTTSNIGGTTSNIAGGRHGGVTSDIGGGRHGDVTSNIGGTTSNVGGTRHNDMNRDTVSPTGGTYNTVAGAGSRDFDGRGNHTLNAVGHQNQPSGILRGSADDSYDNRLRDRDLGRDPQSGLGASGVGAGAGLTGAGLAGAGLANRGNEFHERSNAESRDMGLNPSNEYQAGGGVPQSSMLDPYQTGPNAGRTGPGVGNDFVGDRTMDNNRVGGPGAGAFNSSSTTGAYGATGPVHDSHMANKMDPRIDSDRDGSHTLGRDGRQGGFGNTSTTGPYGTTTGPHDSHMANKMDPRVDSDRDGRQGAFGRDERSGLGAGGVGAAGMAASGLGSSGMGPGHHGPGHDGSKVMHKCSGCGQDNDISHYFRKDAIYRMS